MGRKPDQALSLSQAKAQVVEAAEELSLAGPIRERPWLAVGISAALGFAVAASPAVAKRAINLALVAFHSRSKPL